MRSANNAQNLLHRNRGVLTSFRQQQKGHRWEQDMKPSTYRRVVTMNVKGRSVVQSDEQLQAYEFKSVPNYEHTLVWVNPTTPDLREEQRFVVTFPPSSVFADPSFDGEAARSEALIRLRGLAELVTGYTVAAWQVRGSARRKPVRRMRSLAALSDEGLLVSAKMS
jgi:hypothetical protein